MESDGTANAMFVVDDRRNAANETRVILLSINQIYTIRIERSDSRTDRILVDTRSREYLTRVKIGRNVTGLTAVWLERQ